jgi:hypothetical protein
MNNLIKYSCILFASVALGACGGGSGGGGGGGGSTTTTSTASFALAQALANFVSNSHAINFKVTGKTNGISVTGTGTMSYNAAVGATFEGQAALSQTSTLTATVTGNGTTVPIAQTGTDYYTTNYAPLGIETTGHYCVMQSTVAYPSSVKVGDTAALGTKNCWQDSSKNIANGKDVDSYVVEEDTSTTAIVNFITNVFNTSNVQTLSSQERWRIDQAGNVTFVSLTQTDFTTSPAGTMTFTAQ